VQFSSAWGSNNNNQHPPPNPSHHFVASQLCLVCRDGHWQRRLSGSALTVIDVLSSNRASGVPSTEAWCGIEGSSLRVVDHRVSCSAVSVPISRIMHSAAPARDHVRTTLVWRSGGRRTVHGAVLGILLWQGSPLVTSRLSHRNPGGTALPG
jgi:hypothetical protein